MEAPLFPGGCAWSAAALGVPIAALSVFDSFAHHRAELCIEGLQRL
ncbi:MAG: hypothetical protein AAGI71_12985 [Bacteroidota bacterium]